ncbi:CDGSH iron-sulfur domain-containing protein [Gracilibacillus salitolerans]|uniref:CDGSH iron-sulfur domain-containing protein n=1 Tax=Gracilibacillus salitolerans TaxID=2663022 RepID=A0A5Q2TEE0_9BACI|nr:CDGSH iron-sulfur domain-containing protein [Gracilibacillus salitolerans]QGH33015.1 CDGSH iron-sulfur domain-containing protein [Gracilibacillus salitolerans]
MSEEKDKVQLKVRDNGSILVTGDVELVDAEGNPFETKPKFSLCRCGASKNKPFCDGSHKEIDFQDQIRAK